MHYTITNARTQEVISEDAVFASTPLSRMKGLLGRGSMRPHEAMILQPASSIHTVFMRFSLDVAYLDRENRIVKVVRDLVPFRFSFARRSRTVIEMAGGTFSDLELEPGDELVIRAKSVG